VGENRENHGTDAPFARDDSYHGAVTFVSAGITDHARVTDELYTIYEKNTRDARRERGKVKAIKIEKERGRNVSKHESRFFH
jgi:hypothetical protein